MSIPVQCPACQHAFAVADRFAGKKGKCPKCGAIFKAEILVAVEDDVATFPEVAAPAAVPPPRSTMPPPPVVSHSDSGPVAVFPTVPLTQSAAVSTPLVKVDTQPHPPARGQRKGAKPANLPIIAAAAGGVALLGVIGVVAIFALGSGGDQKIAAKKEQTPETIATQETSTPDPTETKAPPAPPAIDLIKLLPLRGRVFPLTITTTSGTTKACCFLLDKQGYAATSYHAIAKASQVVAIGPGGIEIPIPGTAAIDQAHDIAIIKLTPSLPVALDALPLATTSEPTAGGTLAYFNISAPELPIVAGKIKNSSTVGRLSPQTRAALKRVEIDWADDTTIVQHGLQLQPESVGTPLIDGAGNVVCMQVASADVTGGLAVHAKHLAALLKQAGSEITPWTNTAIATNEPAPSITPATPAPSAPPPVRPMSSDPVDDLIARMKEHQAECDKLAWKAADAREYAQFQLLARFITQAAQLADAPDAPAEGKEKLASAVREVLFGLTADKFPDEAAWKTTSEHAAQGLATPGEGVFALAKVVLPTSAGQMIDNEPVAILQLVGSEQLIFVTTANGAEKFSKDAELLIIGVHDPSLRVNSGLGVALRVRCKYAIAVEKP
ncbi:MAG TPA: trypsin-like peptidase domain-containing protein [Pirellulaceae bacterium]|nr:trypsin-like peptidase domain-containing protein [Pirellulaceae bacterium]